MDFKKWLAAEGQALGPPPDGLPTPENPANGGVGAFPTYSKDDEPPTPRRKMRKMKKK